MKNVSKEPYRWRIRTADPYPVYAATYDDWQWCRLYRNLAPKQICCPQCKGILFFGMFDESYWMAEIPLTHVPVSIEECLVAEHTCGAVLELWREIKK
jgi:hypothetical protein